MKKALAPLFALLTAGIMMAQPQTTHHGIHTGSNDSIPGNGGGFPGFGGGFPDFGGFGGGFPGFGGFGGFGDGEMPDFGNFDMGAMMGEMPEGPTGQVDFQSSNLPVIQIFTDSLRISKQQKINARMQITDNGTGKRNKLTDTPNAYNGYIGIKIRGNSSAAFTQKRFTIELRDENGKDLKAPLLGMPADDDWVLLGPYNDRSMMRDAFAFDLWTEMGHWGSRSRYAELVLNGEYRGVYLVVEKIKRSTDRVDIAAMKKNKNGGEGQTKSKTSDKSDKKKDTKKNVAKKTGDNLTGGYILRVDATDSDCATFRSKIAGVNSATNQGGAGGFGGFGGFGGGFGGGSMPVTWSIFYPKKEALQPDQHSYIEDYIAQTEQAIADGKGYEQYIDVPSFVDYFIHTELSLNADGFKRSAYFYKDAADKNGKGGLLHAGPVWDYNLAYGNCNFCAANDIYAWVYNGCETNPTPAMWKNLAANDTFMKQVKARYAQLRKTLLSKERINAYIDQHAQLLAEAQERHFAKYYTLLDNNEHQAQEPENTNQPGNGGFGGFPGFGGFGGGMMGGGDTSWFDAYTPKDYADEIAILKKWMSDRIDFLDSQWK